jgi:hypothetical protein
MQPALASMLAQAMIDDRIEQADHFRRGRQASEHQEEAYDSVTVRRSRPGDAPALRRLVGRAGGRVPPGDVLVAEVNGRVLAARSLDDGASVADPLQPTGHLVELLALRSAHLREAIAGKRPRRFAAARDAVRRLVPHS